MHTIKRSEAEKRFNRGERVYFAPCKIDLNHLYNHSHLSPMGINKNETNGLSFDDYMKKFQAENCKDSNGLTLKYWSF